MSAPNPSTGHFTCPECGMTSHHPDDVREGYCGRCHDWTGRPDPNIAARREGEAQ
jgi:hypothetical protein